MLKEGSDLNQVYNAVLSLVPERNNTDTDVILDADVEREADDLMVDNPTEHEDKNVRIRSIGANDLADECEANENHCIVGYNSLENDHLNDTLSSSSDMVQFTDVEFH